MPALHELDAVTVDAFGTLLALEDPAERLRLALAERRVERRREAITAAFRAEAAYYRPRSAAGRDAQTLEALRRDCVRVFLEHLQADLDVAEFVPAFMATLVFREVEGSRRALDALRAAGLTLACVANWDVGLPVQLERLGLADRFAVVVTSADAGVEKPDPWIFRLALERIGAAPARALHVGDEEIDRLGALAAGLAFEPAPLATLPERLGLEARGQS